MNSYLATLKSVLPISLLRKIRIYKKIARERKRFSYGEGKPIVATVTSLDLTFDIILDPSRNGGVDEFIAEHGVWETEVSNALVRYVKPNSIFLDIGANIGYHSLLVAAHIRSGTGHIYSFEPIKRLAEQFEKSVASNNFNNITVHRFGLGEVESNMNIHIRDENMGGSSVLSFDKLAHLSIIGKETITIKNLDSVFYEESKIDVIKIDVEGYEFEVLKGAYSILKKSKPIIVMEFSPLLYIQDNLKKPEEFVAFLEGLGYAFFHLSGHPLDLGDWLIHEGNRNSQIDIVCKIREDVYEI